MDDLLNISTQAATYSALIVFAITVLTNIVKDNIYPRWGTTGVHVFSFVLACVGAGLYFLSGYNLTVGTFIAKALQFLLLAVGLYEIILKKIPGIFLTTTEKLAKKVG
jgi:hypothetical protein